MKTLSYRHHGEKGKLMNNDLTIREMLRQAEESVYKHINYERLEDIFSGVSGTKIIVTCVVVLVLIGIILAVIQILSDGEIDSTDFGVYIVVSGIVVFIIKAAPVVLLGLAHFWFFPIELIRITGSWQIITASIIFVISIVVFVGAIILDFTSLDIDSGYIVICNFLIGIGLEILFLSMYFIPRISY